MDSRESQDKWSYQIIWVALKPVFREVERYFWTAVYRTGKFGVKVAHFISCFARKKKPPKRG
jgi:hypothetical protein